MERAPFARATFASAMLCMSLSGCIGIPQDQKKANTEIRKEVIGQSRRELALPADGVYASTDFDGARLIDFQRLGEGLYRAVVEPENMTAEPWFAFKIRAARERDIAVEMVSRTVNFPLLALLNPSTRRLLERLTPVVSADRMAWTPLPEDRIQRNKAGFILRMRLHVGPVAQFVSLWELATSGDYDEWYTSMIRLPYVAKREVGRSVEGRPIIALEISEAPEGSKTIVLTGRQHPSEVTGWLSLRAFMETIAGDSDTARAFRKRYGVLAFPLVNPDGVDDGFSRCNANGINLDRDWMNFLEPETRAVREAIAKSADNNPASIRFFIDFHSTGNDMFYVIPPEELADTSLTPARRAKRAEGEGLVKAWISSIQASLPSKTIEVSTQCVKEKEGTVDKWMALQYDVPALTWETGTFTDRASIEETARTAAMRLMELLLNDRPNDDFPFPGFPSSSST